MKILEKKDVFRGQLLNVRADRLEDEGGRETVREFVVHPGGVAILAHPSPGEILFVEQYRYPVGETLIELPAGTLEPGEDPLRTAHRELEEETGYRAERMNLVASYYTTPGFTSELMYFYQAGDLTSGAQRLEDDESIEVVVLRREQAMEMMRNGRIRDAKTLIGLLMVFPL
jgi:ADP-ribose pyrophosphatase